MADALLTIEEAANTLRLQPCTLRAWILRRKLPYIKLGRSVRIRRSDVDALLSRGFVPARPNRAAEEITYVC